MMKLPVLSLSISAMMIGLFVSLGQTPEHLIWVSGNITIKPWSVLTAHFVHISVEHLIWNLGAFIILASIIEQTSKRALCAALAVGIFAVNTYLAFFYSLDAYAGLSGVLNTLLVVALFKLTKLAAYRSAAMLTLGASLVKIAFELSNANSVFTSLPWPPVPEAHLAGWLAGLCFTACWYAIDHFAKNQNNNQRLKTM